MSYCLNLLHVKGIVYPSRLHLSLFISFIVIFNVILFFRDYLYRFGKIELSVNRKKAMTQFCCNCYCPSYLRNK